jgi:hypothetical protein
MIVFYPSAVANSKIQFGIHTFRKDRPPLHPEKAVYVKGNFKNIDFGKIFFVRRRQKFGT